MLNGTQIVVLDEAFEYGGETFESGTDELAVDGRDWTDFDRMHPIEAPARSMAREGAHGILASTSSGLAADYQAGFAHVAAWRTMLMALVIGLVGVGLVRLSARREEQGRVVDVRERELETIG